MTFTWMTYLFLIHTQHDSLSHTYPSPSPFLLSPPPLPGAAQAHQRPRSQGGGRPRAGQGPGRFRPRLRRARPGGARRWLLLRLRAPWTGPWARRVLLSLLTSCHRPSLFSSRGGLRGGVVVVPEAAAHPNERLLCPSSPTHPPPTPRPVLPG